MKTSEIRAPMDGLLTAIKTIDGELVAERAELFTVASRKNYVRGEVDEEDVGEVKVGMEAIVQVYAFRTRQFQRQSLGDSTGRRSRNAALHHCPGSGKSAGKSDGRHDRRNEHHHRQARKCAASADRARWSSTRCSPSNAASSRCARSRSVIAPSTLPRFSPAFRRRPRRHVRPGQIAPRETGPATPGQNLAPARSTVTPPLYIALRFLGHRKRAFILSLRRRRFRRGHFHLHPGADRRASPKISSIQHLGSNGVARALLALQTAGQRHADRAEKHERRTRTAVISKASSTPAGSCGSAGNSRTSPPARRFCAALLSARAGFETATVDLVRHRSRHSRDRPPICAPQIFAGKLRRFSE